MTKILLETDPIALPAAISLLKAGQTVAFPTETVYGLGVLTMIPNSLRQLYDIKGRDESKAITIMLPDLTVLDDYCANIPSYGRRLASAFWPGALTLVFNRHPNLSVEYFPLPTIGIRIPDYPFVQALLAACGPMAVTSANLSGQPSAIHAAQVLQQLDNRIPLLIDGGECRGGIASTVVDCTGAVYKILRQGELSSENLQSVL